MTKTLLYIVDLNIVHIFRWFCNILRLNSQREIDVRKFYNLLLMECLAEAVDPTVLAKNVKINWMFV